MQNDVISTKDPNLLAGKLKVFLQYGGELYINSVFVGGSFTFLINQSKLKPIIVVDVRNLNLFHAKLYLNTEEFDFTINDLCTFIINYKIENLNINHIIWSENLTGLIQIILEILKKNTIKSIFYIHDFYSVCPTINLLNYNANFCGLPDNNTCKICLEKYSTSITAINFMKNEVMETQNIHKNNILNWRNVWRELICAVDEIILPSNSAAELWLQVYPEARDKICILHHDLKYISTIKKHINNVKNDFFQVYVIGDIIEHKGAGILHEILILIKKNELNVTINVLGAFEDEEFINTPYLKLHGRFTHTDLPHILNNSNIDCFLMTSIWPETFSYTTHEMIATGLPIISFMLGAQGDFISKYINGIVIEKVDGDLFFYEIKKLYEKHLSQRYLEMDLDDKNIRFLINENSKLQFRIQENNIIIDNLQSRIRESETLQRETMHTNTKISLFNEEVNRINLELMYSTSWKITAPLRYGGKFFRKLINILNL